MKFIKQSFEIIEQGPGLNGIKKQIELAGRTCYKSLDKITEDSAEGFVQRMVDSHHYAMLEHGTVYLKMLWDTKKDWNQKVASIKYQSNPYSKVRYVNTINEGEYKLTAYVTTNYRVIIENHWEDDLQYVCEPTEYHEKRHTVVFTTSRQVTHEFVRHRVFSFAQESTRYCNYTKGKFGSELTYIVPCWQPENLITPAFIDALSVIENKYFDLINQGWKAQEAALILPNDLKAEIVMTGSDSDWKHFFDLRALGTTGAPHPQAKEAAYPVMQEFYNRGYVTDDKYKG